MVFLFFSLGWGDVFLFCFFLFRPSRAQMDREVALHSAVHNRFVKMDGGHMSGSAHKAADALPPKSESTSERFAVVPAMHGDEIVIALHSTIHNRFISMTPNGVTAYVVNAHELSNDATWERFRVVKL